MNFLLAWLVSLVYIGAKALQQRHVQHAEFWRMPIPSYLMAVCEVFVASSVIKHYDDPNALAILAFSLGTGAWMGSMLGTWIHLQGRK